MAFDIAINPDLDPGELRAAFIERGRLQVPNFFTADTADALYKLLQENTRW